MKSDCNICICIMHIVSSLQFVYCTTIYDNIMIDSKSQINCDDEPWITSWYLHSEIDTQRNININYCTFELDETEEIRHLYAYNVLKTYANALFVRKLLLSIRDTNAIKFFFIVQCTICTLTSEHRSLSTNTLNHNLFHALIFLYEIKFNSTANTVYKIVNADYKISHTINWYNWEQTRNYSSSFIMRFHYNLIRSNGPQVMYTNRSTGKKKHNFVRLSWVASQFVRRYTFNHT